MPIAIHQSQPVVGIALLPSCMHVVSTTRTCVSAAATHPYNFIEKGLLVMTCKVSLHSLGRSSL